MDNARLKSHLENWPRFLLVCLLCALVGKFGISRMGLNKSYIDLIHLELKRRTVWHYPICQDMPEKSLFLLSSNTYSSNMPLLRLKIMKAWLAGSCDKVISMTENVDSPIILLLRAKALQGLGYYEDAVDVYHQSHATHYPELMAYEALKQEDITSGVDWLEMALLTEPNPWVVETYSNLYASMGNVPSFEQSWQRLVDLSHESNEYHWRALAEISKFKNDWLGVAQAYAQGAEFSKSPYNYLVRSGDAFLRVQDLTQAEIMYLKALELRPDLSAPYLGLGSVSRLRMEYREAINWYNKADNIEPGIHWPQHMLGLTYYQMGEYFEALGYFQRAQSELPGMNWNEYYLARVYYILGDDDAFSYIDGILTRGSELPGFLPRIMGDWLLEIGESQRAIRAYQLGLEANPADQDILKILETLTQEP